MNPILVAVILLLVVIYVLKYVWSMRQFYYYSKVTPGPLGLPILGNILDFIGNSEEISNKLSRTIEKWKPLGRIWLGNQLFFISSNPKYVQILMNEALERHGIYKTVIGPCAGNGLMSAGVARWKKNRKMISPTFNKKVIDGFMDIFESQTEILLEKLDPKVNVGYFNIFDIVSKCTLDIVCETMLQKKVNAQLGKTDHFVASINRGLELSLKRITNFWYNFDFIWERTSLHKELVGATKAFRGFIEQIVLERRNEFEFKKHDVEEETESRTFLNHLIGGNILSNEEIIDEAVTVIGSGSDTSATTISFTLVMLGMNPSIQEKTYEEISSVFHDSKITPEKLNQLVYLERVIKETLRFFPLSPFLSRSVQKDIKLDDNYTVPKGSSFIAGIMNLHRDPEIWQFPMSFDPDRFLPEEVAKRHPYSYVPFSAGPRNCIGEKYAMMSMKAILSRILTNYKLFTEYQKVTDIKVKSDLLIQCIGGFNVALERR